MRKNNYIKTGLLLITFLLSTLFIDAQEEVVVPLSNPGEKGKLTMYLLTGSISVMSHNKNEVIVRAAVRSSRKSKGKQKYGLQKIDANAVRFSVEEVDNRVRVKSKNLNTAADYEIMVPKNFSLKLNVTNSGHIYVENVKGELEVSNTNGKIDMKNVSGSVIADALNRNITVTFDEIFENESMAFSSLNGNLDITFPANLAADVKAKTDHGAIYTDFELKIVDKEADVEKTRKSNIYKVNVDKWTYGTINGGGPELLFKTLNGDIIIRKK
ncbi:MAG: hypothetical protein QNJ57_08395 [Flavobacteriaceae bacterium]|nr:hypothetical protein [Flavobacteriaceae bacterium]